MTALPPAVSLTSPASGSATAPASLTLTATASAHNGSIARVEFYDNGLLVGTDSSAPYSRSYANLETGSHAITAKAIDSLGQSTLSAAAVINVSAAGSVSATRHYVYDAHQRLCKTVEPETGASFIDYDAAGNVAWTAQGSTLTSLTCDRAAVPVNEKTTRSYDAMNRVIQLTTPDGIANVSTSYTPDGLVASLTANNLGTNNAPVTTTYSYNQRRMLVSETSSQPNGYSFSVGYAYNANGHLASHTYPLGQVVSYSPDALGRTTAVTGSGGVTYASGLSYHPSGAIAGFTYGNGVVHTLTQNARQLPGQSRDAKAGMPVVLDDTYTYDKNGNVLDITDQAQAGKTTRGMGYDALDRLTAAISPQQWNTATYAYDALDNLKVADQGSRQYRYSYDAITNRLTTISNPAGQTQISLTHDARGNVTSKTQGSSTQTLAFDYGNRLSYVAGQEYYGYDGLGRRVNAWTSSSGINNLWVYSQSGQLLFTDDLRRNRTTDSIYLGNTLLAQRHVADGTGVVTVAYQHTDSLGSVVAVTNASGAVVERFAYAPYGEEYTTGAKTIDGQGYTGHVMDLMTGFTYMQQRYYDPTIGRFLSVDPMASNMQNGWNFNRYYYANNSPYRFTDPDGRATVDESIDNSAENCGGSICRGAHAGVKAVWGLAGQENVSQVYDKGVDAGAITMISAAIDVMTAGRGNTVKEGAQVAAAAGKGLLAKIRSLFPCSFDADTLVETDDGLIRIIDVSVGDLVLARNELTGIETYQEVLANFSEWHGTTRTITLKGVAGEESIITTDEHPFYVVGKGFVHAVELQVGYQVQLAGGATAAVVASERNETGQLAYNLTVANDHTYFVGESRAWVHNSLCGFARDYTTRNTRNWSAMFKSEGEARALARQKLGANPVEIDAGKWRSADGKWQYRAKPGDVSDNHIHLEELNPATGEVLQNLHLRWPDGAGR